MGKRNRCIFSSLKAVRWLSFYIITLFLNHNLSFYKYFYNDNFICILLFLIKIKLEIVNCKYLINYYWYNSYNLCINPEKKTLFLWN